MHTDDHPDRPRLFPWVGVLAGLVLVVAAAWAADFIPGDVNDDGVFDIADPTVLRRELAGLGPGISQLCGNGVLDAGEECDSGVICSDLGFAFGELVCDAGCVAQVDTCTNTRFEDLGLTVFDHQTGLEWEKKTGTLGTPRICEFDPFFTVACTALRDVDNQYEWKEAMSEWITRINGIARNPNAQLAGLGGKTDWRLPTIAELRTIRNCGFGPPSINPIFGSTDPSFYWSSSNCGEDCFWIVNFDQCRTSTELGNNGRGRFRPVRAVRSGPPTCGDGLLNQASEECDSPNDFACPGACSSDCTCPATPICGDGVPNTGEECDDGNNLSGDCCSSECQLESPGSSCASDANLCTDDVCDGAGTCTHPNNTAICDDGDSCTDPDQCQNGSCVAGPLCADHLPSVVSTSCISGSCEIESCASTLYDVNQTFSDGCECQEDLADQAGLGDVCAAAYDLGVLPDDGSSSFTVTGNIVPGQDSDWFKVIFSDSNDALDAGISFQVNPGGQFAMRIYADSCASPVCFGDLGSLNYRGAAGQDDTVEILVEVFRLPQLLPSCDSYTLQVGHGASGSGGPNCSVVVPPN